MKILFWMFIGFDQHATSEHLLSAVIEQLCKSGHTVHILQKDTGGTLPHIPYQLEGYSVTTDIVPYKEANKGNLIKRYLTEIKYVNACRRFIKTDYDAVFIQSTTVAGFAVKAVRKIIPNAIISFNVQDIFPYNAVFSGSIKRNGVIFKTLSAIQRYGYRHSDHIITISEDMKETLIADGVTENKVEVVYNWSYQDKMYENIDLSPVAYMFHKEYFNVVYAGNIGVMQNVDLIVDAAKIMVKDDDIWFHIIGNGVYKDKLEKRAKEYGIKNISFWPIQPPEFAPAIYSMADINVIPLVKNVYRTALPSKTATCLACKKPIIFAIGNNSKFANKVREEVGAPIAESDKPEELVSAIRKIKNGKIKYSSDSFFLKYCQISKNSKKYVEIITQSNKR